MKTKKLDLGQEFRHYYTARRTPELVDLGPGTFLTIEGQGRPEGDRFQHAIRALYSVAYTAKMQLKAEGQDFKMAPLEGLWWTPEGVPVGDAAPERWRWKLLIRVPETVDAPLVGLVKESVGRGRGILEAADVRLERLDEGHCLQILHVGPYAEEPESIRRLAAAAADLGLRPSGRHHEIYLSDPNRTKPERLRTILRQPVN